jgi:hypothetical protein
MVEVLVEVLVEVRADGGVGGDALKGGHGAVTTDATTR